MTRRILKAAANLTITTAAAAGARYRKVMQGGRTRYEAV
jgi:hypothetical protein